MTPNECGTCDETFICSMGCREVSKLKHDNYKTIDPWCNPNNAKERTFFLKEINLKDHETYKIQPNIKYRNEENSKKLIFEPQSRLIALVNKDLFSFVSELSRRKTFNIGNIKQEFGDKSLKIIKYLKSKNIIKLQEV